MEENRRYWQPERSVDEDITQDPIRTDSGKEINLVRCENVKNIMEYIDRVDEMIERKGEWLWR